MDKRLFSILFLVIFVSCGPRILYPPEFNLIPYEQIGVISFSVENVEGDMDKMATQQLVQEITQSQKSVQIIELGSMDEVLLKINKTEINLDAAKAIGEQFGVTAFFYGDIKATDFKPGVDIAGLLQGARVQAKFNVIITARLLSTENSATLWTNSVSREESVAYVSMVRNGIPVFDIKDQEETAKRLIQNMIHDLTWDFRPYWR